MDKLRALLVTGCGTGYLPIAPGTWGSAGAAAVAWVAYGLGAPGWMIWLLAVPAFVANIVVVPLAERATGKKDPGEVCIDEVGDGRRV